MMCAIMLEPRKGFICLRSPPTATLRADNNNHKSIAELEREAEAKDNKIAELEREAEAKDNKIAELEGEAEAKDNKIAELEREAAEAAKAVVFAHGDSAQRRLTRT